MRRGCVFLVVAWLAGCAGPTETPDASAAQDAFVLPRDTGGPLLESGVVPDAGSDVDAASAGDARDRLLASYLAFLEETPTVAQTNGLRGADLADVCDLWSSLDPSSQATYLTLTSRLAGSHLRDGSSMLDHVVRLYRLTGGDGATATDPGSCGNGEYNRILVSMDTTLHDALNAANASHGALGADGLPDLADAPAGTVWRNSHDIGGPHAPFDLSDETEQGLPRGQVQFFQDPASSAAMAPLGRVDLMTLVDPHALELDQDYDCTHNSNPSCSYTFYGGTTGCLPGSAMLGVELYAASYGHVDLAWRPTGCP